MPRPRPPSGGSGALYFEEAAAFRRWLAGHHASAPELLVGFHKRGSGRPSLTWPESVDEALCFGWIDGVRRSVDGARYTIRFTPRRPGSTWSAINVARAKALAAAGRLRPAGRAAFEARTDDRTARLSSERRTAAALTAAQERRLRADAAAWAHWSAQPPSYRRIVAHWVSEAKKEETREARLATLIACSARGEPVPPMRWTGKGKAAARARAPGR